MSIDTAISTINSTIDDLRSLVESKLSKAVTINGKSLGSSSTITLTKRDLGLGNVNNTSDLQKPVSVAQRSLIDSKVDKSTTINGISLSSNVILPDPLAGRFDQVDNTSDANKPLSIACQSALAAKVDNSITINGYALTSDIALDHIDIGLDQVDNTSDSDKPISISVQAALDTINSTLDSISTALSSIINNLNNYVLESTTVNGHPLSSNLTLTGADIGLDQVNNTSDINKPISTAQSIVNATKLGYRTFLSSANFYLRNDMFTVPNEAIDFFPVNQRGSDSTPANYLVSGTLYKRIYTVDGAWQADIFLPDVNAYSKYTHIYFHCASSFSFSLHASRSDMSQNLQVDNGEVAVFVSSIDGYWAYLGKLSASV